MQEAAAGSSVAGKQEVTWFLRPPPLAHRSGAVPLPLPCPYLMSAHHNRYLLSQNEGWRARGAQQDAASRVLGQNNARRLHAGFADTAIIRRPSSWSAGVASRWSSSSWTAAVPSPSSGRSSISSTEQQPASWAMTNKQQVPSRIAVPNLEISLGRQGWQHNHQQDHHHHQPQQQQQRSGESTAPKELTLLKCL